jgi:hypothetical protein
MGTRRVPIYFQKADSDESLPGVRVSMKERESRQKLQPDEMFARERSVKSGFSSNLANKPVGQCR